MPGPADTPSAARAEAARVTMSALTGSPDVFELFFDSARIGLALAGLDTRFVRVNATYAELLGRAPEDLVGVPFPEVLHPDDAAPDIAGLLGGRLTSVAAEERFVGADGRVTWVLHGVTAVAGADGRPAWFAVSAQDITERRRAEQELRELTAIMTERAVRDPLTGLANRALLEERLRAALSRDARSGGTTAVLFLDLDGFKAVNDAHGHAVGDAVLRVLGGRLQSVVRPSDTVARLGGDEFVVLVEGAADLEALSERLRAAVGEPVEVGGLTLTVGVSIGCATATGGGADPSGLLARADRHMYDVKRGRGGSPS